jgi:hypothetical protein
MTRLGTFLLLALLPPALAADDKKPDPKEAKKPATFISKAGRFSVLLPGKPAEKTAKVQAGGQDAELHIFSATADSRSHVVTYSDYPAGVVGADKEKFLAGVVERNVERLKAGKLTANEKVSLGKGKHPGRDVRVELPDKKRLYRARVYLVGDRLYQVVVLGPTDAVKGKEADDFLNSFAVTD